MRQLGSKTAHNIVHVPIVERPGSFFPLLLLEDGSISLIAAAYARNLQRENFSPAKVHDNVAVIERFYDFFKIKMKGESLKPHEWRLLLGQFAEARLVGTLQPGGAYDPSGLYWSGVKFETVRKDVDNLTAFSKWVSDNLGTIPLNPVEERYGTALREAYRLSILINTSPLAHLLPARKNLVPRRHFELHNNVGSHLRDIPKTFPPQMVIKLIETAANSRDKLAFMLMAFGSLRISEVCHLFLKDLFGTFSQTRAAHVTLGHPVDGRCEWVDKNGRRRSGTRAEYLVEMYGRVPRNRMDNSPEYAGWKAMEFGNKSSTGFIYWSVDAIGIYFRRVLYEYFEEIFAGKPQGWPGHPYAFVKLDRAHYGEPMTIVNLANQFYAAAMKIGLDPRQEGINPHGLRHFYGYFCATILKLRIERLQQVMHHASPLSTNVYYHIPPQVVRDQLLAAQIAAGLLEDDRREIKGEFRGSDVTLPRHWLSSLKDPFGLKAHLSGFESSDDEEANRASGLLN
jgi:integrase